MALAIFLDGARPECIAKSARPYNVTLNPIIMLRPGPGSK